MNDTIIPVPGERGYDVVVGIGTSGVDRVAAAIGSDARKVLVVHAPALAAQAERLRTGLAEGYEVYLAEVPDAEAAKRVEVAAFCWQVMGQTEFTRSDVVVGIGGGATTDLAGFVAATWLRGVRVVLVPTTVLGMVDAAVGGKTAINTAEGKNLVGAFWAPAAVLVDLDCLESLPRNELLTGMAEVVKAGFIAEPEILELVEQRLEDVTDPGSAQFRRALELAIGMKARVVGEDFTEQGLREVLNYGHTLGHAVEHAERYRWRHGAAVSVGMVYAAELSRLTRGLDDASVARHRDVLDALGLPTEYPAGRWQTLLGTMHRDKKARAGMLRFIVLDGIARPTTYAAVDESLLFAAYQEIAS